MLKLIITLSMFMTALVCKAQVSEIRKVEDFSKIEVASGIELHYIETEKEATLKVESKDGILTDIITEVEGGTLKIYTTGKGKQQTQQEIKVYVSSKNIESLKAISKSRIVLHNTMHAKNISINLQLGAYFKGYVIANQDANVETGKNTEFNGRIEAVSFFGNFKNFSKVNISGKSQNAFVISSEKAYCNAKNFLTENTKVDSDNATVIITSKNKIKVNATENAVVTYFGSPKKVTIEDQLVTTKKYTRPSFIAMD